MGLYRPSKTVKASLCIENDLGNSLDIKLIEIVPIEYKRYFKRLITYKRIKTEKITKIGLLRIFELINAQQPLQVLDSPKFFITQYASKPILFISKDLGRIYSYKELGFQKEVLEHQASILITILNRVNLVEDLHYSNLPLNGGKNKNSKNKEP